MSRMRSNLLALAAGSLAVGFVASCDTPTKVPTTGNIAPRIELVRRDTSSRASAVLPPTIMRARVIGPTSDAMDLVQVGSNWTGRFTGLDVGSYVVIIEGIANGQVQYYGRVENVSVARGQTAAPTIPFAEAVPAVNAPTLTNTMSFSQRLVFNRVPAATGYTVEYTQAPTFDAGVTAFVSPDTNPLIAVTQPGTWYMRTRAILPNVLANSVPWSDVRSWIVLESDGGDDETDPQPVPVTPTDAAVVGDRNLTPNKRSDWHDFDVEAGDSLFVETFAARLTNASPLNTLLRLFKEDGSTEIATNDNITGSTDSRIVIVVPETERVKVEVAASTGTSNGHYELRVEIRRLPDAPTSLDVEVLSGTSVALEWVDNANDETGFDIERCINAGCTDPDFQVVATVDANVTTYVDAGLLQGNDYNWRVRARNAVGTSAPTNAVHASTQGPAAPSELTATTMGNSQIDLAWVDNATNETGFEVQRCSGADCEGFTVLATVPADMATYSDLSAAFNTVYRYRVRAINNVVPSDFSNIGSANTIPPATPTALSATVMGPTRIDLAWTDNAADETGFRIERCTGDACSNFVEIATVLADVETYQDNTVANNEGYRYRVRAYHAVTGQDYTNTANADTRPPTAPSLLTATTTSGTSIALTWQDNSDDELDFSIQRCSSGPTCTDFTQIALVSGAAAYTDNTATVGNSYRYQVVAIGVPGNSAPSNIASANTLLPAAPTGLTASTIDATNIELNWTDNSDNETGWEISRCTGNGCPTPTPLDTIAAGTTTYIDATVQAGEIYVYAVRALNISGASDPTNNASANTLPPSAPTGLSATTISGTQVDLAWTNTDASITGTRVERCSEPCGEFAEIAFVPEPASAYADLTAEQGNVYQYRVRAQNSADVSDYTAAVSASTELPAAPTGLTATTVSPTQIELTWVQSIGPGVVVGYALEFCEGLACTEFEHLVSLGAEESNYIVFALASESDFVFRVRTVNAVGASVLGTEIAGNTRTPATPTDLAATTMVGIVRLTWTDNADNELGVLVERCSGAACTPIPVELLQAADVETWDDSSVVADAEYTYRVRAYNNVGASSASTASVANTLIADPVTVISATSISPTQINLAWTPSASQGTGLILGYNVYRCDGVCDPATGTVLDSLPSDADAYEDATVVEDGEYTYAVVPHTAFGQTSVAGSATAFASTALPAAPTGLTGVLLGPTAIQLLWNDNAANETQFEVAQCAGEGCTDFATVAILGPDLEEYIADTLTFSVDYRFIVRAVNTAGASPWTDTLEIGTTVPAMPTDFAVYITNEVGNFRLLWTDASDDETMFTIDICTGAGCESWAEFASVDANTTQLDIGSGGGVTYRFRVRAVNAAGLSEGAVTQITGDGPYAPPTGTLATTTGPTSIRLTWTDQTDNETVFRILRCTGGACDPLAGTVVDSVPRDTTAFDDTTVSTGELYRYAVVAANGFSAIASAAFDGHTMPPDAPGTLSATTISSTEISLTWSDGGPFETGYVIERCQGGGCGTFAPIDTVPANFVSYSDMGLTPNATYRYRVQAINAVDGSAYSNIVERATNIPATPSGLEALAMTATRIDLAWIDNATNEDFYIVERCAGVCDAAGAFGEIETQLAPGAQAYVDNTVSAGLTYSYRVRALNAGGVSPASNIATATTAVPLNPTDLTVTVLSGTLIELTWTDNATNETVYQVYRCSVHPCTEYALVEGLPANTTMYVDTVAVDGEYTYRVRAVNDVGPSGPAQSETVNTFRPAAPSDFTVSTVSATRIDLSWTDNAANEDGYVLERCSGDGCDTFVLLDSLPPDANSYQNDGIASQTSFTYRLYAYNIAGQSGVAGPGTATTITPAAPTGLSAVLAAPGQINLSWTDNATNELQYRVERCAGSTNCSTPELMDANAVEVATLPPNASGYSDAGLAGTTLYFYRVRATNIAGSSPYSAIVSRSTAVPPAPTGLSSFTILATRVELFWTDNSANEEGFRVERCIGEAPCTSFTEIAQLPVNAQSYVDTDPVIDAQPFVYYRVIAFNGGGGNASNVSFASTVVPAAPTDFVAVANGPEAVSLTWVDNANDEAGFLLERCTGLDCTDFVLLDSLIVNATAYDDGSASSGNIYRYRLAAFGNGRSDFAPIASVATIGPDAPSDLVATAVSDTRVDLTWTDNTPSDSLWNEVEFRIYRCAGASCTPEDLVGTVGADTTFFSDSLLTPGVTYSYEVVAYNFAGVAVSNVATAETNVPAIPTSLADSTISATEVLLTWVDNAGNETGFAIERCAGSSCTDFAPLDTAAANEQSRVMGGLVGTTAYRFRVRAFNASGSSGWSNEVVAQSDVPPAPTDLVGAMVSSSQVNLAWVDNAENETAYIIERCDGTGCGSWAVVDSLPPNTTTFQDVTVSIDTLYQYRVRASNIVGPSPYATEIAVSAYRPEAPADLVATPFSATRVDLTWTDVAVNDTVIIVERCLGGGCTDFTDIDSLPPDATAFSDLTVTVNNSYNYRLRAENAAGASAPTASAAAHTFIPSDPSGLTATVNSASQITLDWVDNSSTEDDFLIERCEGDPCGAFAELAVVTTDVITYQDVTVSIGNVYAYRVIARAGGGNSGPSNVATVNTFPAGDVASLTASPLTPTTLQLSWTAADFASSYDIATVSGSDTTFFASTSAAVTDTVVTVLTDAEYNFVVRASNAAGVGAYTGAFVAMTPPPAPVGLTVFPLTTSQVTLAWTDTSDRETGFEVERSFFSGDFGAYQTVSTLGANVTTDIDEVPAATGRYRYRVRAVNQVGAGEYSNVVDLTLTAPTAPTGLSAVVTAPGQISLTWTDNSNSEESFLVERSVGDALNFTQLATLGPNTQAHIDSSAIAINTTYYYQVRALNSIGPSPYTNQASTVTTVPNAVFGMTSEILSSTSIQLNWNGSVTSGELGFRVYRCVGGGCVDYTLLDGSVPADATTYTDLTASYGGVFRYQVRPYNIAGEPAANPTHQRILTLPVPFLDYVVPQSRTALRAAWAGSNMTWETGFEIERCTGLDCSEFEPLATLAANDTSYISGGLTPNGTWYGYRVRAVADGNLGPWSTVRRSHTPREVTLGGNLVTSTAEEISATEFTIHYVVSMPAGSPTVEISIGDDPGGSTVNNGSYLLVQRDKPLARHPQFHAGFGTLGDTLCAPPEFIFGGQSVTCSLSQPGVATDYFITTYSYQYTNLRILALPGPTTYTFNNCTQTGRVGPTQGLCDAAYTGTPLQGQVAVADLGFQDWTVPFSGRWAVTATGARGAAADPAHLGGRGARIYGEFVLTQGQNLRMAVGQMGTGAASNVNGGGGGGSFVFDLTGSTPLLIAGGGGGTRWDVDQDGCDASVTVFGTIASGGAVTTPCTVKNVDAGLGGVVSAYSWGSAGAGFNGNGAGDLGSATAGGRSWANLIVGGLDLSGYGDGGFGGAGSGYGGNGGGGGGGYSGGDGGRVAGGGGSFNAGTNTAAFGGVGTTHGTIILKYLGPATP